MSQNVRKGEELKELELLEFLHANELITSAKSAIDIKQFANGYSNLTYQLDVEDKSYVLRRPPFGAVKRGHDMGREYKVLSKLKTGFDQCPKVYAFSDSSAVMDAPFYLMEKVDGIILTVKESKKRQIASDQFTIVADTWLDTFVRLHHVDYASVGLEDLGRPAGYVQRQVENWSKQYLKAATLEVPEAKQVMAWMQDNQPKTYEHTLIHNDFKYDNVVFKDDSWKHINAVLDWEMCTLGDPLMDLGTSLAYWTMHTDGDMVVNGLPSPTMFEGNPGRLEVVEAYASKSNRSIQNLVFYYVFGMFKIAVIAQQIYYRYHKGMTSDEKFAHLDKSSQFLCMYALQAIQKNKIENLF
ncbi:MAG: phosphotransferase family protein [Saprospiraceae bacterium]|nr:phosphotransferase family protein [Saprospiraceae bacterium]